MPSAPDPLVPDSVGPGSVEPRVTLIGKPGCHLCEAARAVVAEVTAELGESFTELSILDRPDLMARYAEEVPVTLVDGRQHDYWRVDPARLRAALSRPRPPSRP
ncbi:glutaredoxin family protein [Knoellia aerolata]|uniref:Glutaredoxin n=1 Tax=Knoellia aerolata DSM 18566 TaxID=1385519 RepID=A0A0A0K0E4_9MICO|nr:glutaredoxin family protein [Knoellia aerolata]KGN42903.1 glutaredoxin [Knoellia aerolata DSM 18566]